MSKPLVTVMTPTYNRAGWLPETIESVLAQDYPDSCVEYIVLDDGSSDNTRQLAELYGDRLQYVYQENQGEPATVNNGWRMAKGDYFAVVNSDDLVQSNWLSSSIEMMEANPQLIVTYPDWYLIDKETKPLREVKSFEYDFYDMLSWFHCMPGPGAVIKKSALRDVPVLRERNFRYASDFYMWLKLGLKGPFARVPKYLATWRQHNESITVAGDTLHRGLELIELAETFYSEPGLPPEVLAMEKEVRGRAYQLAAILTRDARPMRSYFFSRQSCKLREWHDTKLPTELRGGTPHSFAAALAKCAQDSVEKIVARPSAGKS